MSLLLHNLVFRRSRTDPRRTALIETDRRGSKITYTELAREIERMAGRLICRGLGKGDRFGILSKNSIGFVKAFFAASRAGGIAVPLNYTLTTPELIRTARHAGICGLYAGKGFEKKAAAMKKAVESIRFMVGERMPSNRNDATSRPIIREGDVAAIIYTSGSTGEALGVMLSHKNLISNAKSVVQYTRIGPPDSIVCVLPFYYIYGLSVLLSHLSAGGTVLIDNRFMYPEVVLDAIERLKATGFAGVSSHYGILLGRSSFKDRRLASVRYFLQAGDKMPAGWVKGLRSVFPRKRLYLMYGQTEASPRISYLDPSLTDLKPGSVGKAIPGVRLKVLNGRRECAAGVEGEIAVHGDNIMLGYWKNSAETKKALKKRWLYTGDIGYKDKDGDLFLTGRRKRFIKVGGRKTNPCDVAGMVMKHPDIFEASLREVLRFSG